MKRKSGDRTPPERDIAKLARTLGHVVAIPAAGASSGAIFLGIYPDASSSGGLNVLLPFIAAGVAFIGLAACWWVVLDLAADEKTNFQKALVAGIAGVLFCVGVGTSAHFLAAIIGGVEAVQAHQEEFLGKVRSVANTVASNATKEESLIGAVNGGASALHASADAENKLGVVSKQRGPSVVYQSLLNASGALEKLAENMRNAARVRDNKLAAAQEKITEANEAIALQDAGQFREAASHAATNVAAAGKINLASFVNGLGIGLIPAPQAKAPIANIFEQITGTATLIGESRQPVKKLDGYIPATMKAAVLSHPPGFAWTVATLLEAFPCLMCLLVMLAAAKERDDDDDAQAPPATIAEPRPRPTLVAVE